MAGDSRNSASLTASQGASSQSSESENPHQRHKDAPLHMQAKHPLPRNLDNRERHADAPLQLEARRRPLQAAAAADFYAPDDPDDNDNSDTSSMVVLARAKRKHKLNSSSDASETTSQKEQSSLIDRESHKQATASNKSKNEGNGMDAANGRDSNVRMDDAEEDDRKPPAQPLAHVAQAVRQENNDDDSNDQDQEEQAQGNSSSSSEQCVAPGARAQHQPIHAYDLPHIVTESGSNNNTTSGSGSGGNSGSNQGSSGSGNGSSGNGSSGSGNEAKNISEEAGAKEETSPDTNSNSEDINSGDQKPDDRMEIANPVTARRGQGTADADHAMKQDPASLPTNANSDHNPAEEAIKERKRFEKKRKRLNMRREYEEKVQQELESSESSVSYGAVNLRPGKPITLDKVLSFSKIAR